MPLDDDVKTIKDQVDKLRERVGRLQNLAWVLGTLAAILGLGGASLWSQLSTLRTEASTLKDELAAIEKNVVTYRKDVEDARANLQKAVQAILTPELDEARRRLQEAGDGAVKRVQDQQATSSQLLQRQIAVGDKCAAIASLQVCWGAAEVTPHGAAPHTAGFSFTFERPFARTPIVANGINTDGSGHALGVYKWSATPSSYTGWLNNMYVSKPIDGKVTMQYIAIGPAK